VKEDWQVFQTDVLSVLRQYSGYFSSTEHVASISRGLRPDFLGTVRRESKKEVWILDAKNKSGIGNEDIERMEEYVDTVTSNPVDAGVDPTDISRFRVRGIFVTRSGEEALENFETVQFESLHQFLQEELVYTDTGKVVRSISKMLEKGQLSQDHARILHRGTRRFRRRRNVCMKHVRDIDRRYTGIDLDEPPFKRNLPAEALLRHGSKRFLIEFPYSRDEVRNPEDIRQVKDLFDTGRENVFFLALNTFDEEIDEENVLRPERLETEIQRETGIIPLEKAAKMFEPRTQTKINLEKDRAEVSGPGDFELKVSTQDNRSFKVKSDLEEKLRTRIIDARKNSPRSIGEFRNGRFILEFHMKNYKTVEYGSKTTSLRDFRDAVNSVFVTPASRVT
jgi:hypothetical protein